MDCGLEIDDSRDFSLVRLDEAYASDDLDKWTAHQVMMTIKRHAFLLNPNSPGSNRPLSRTPSEWADERIPKLLNALVSG
jgi:hypothetical protein